MARGARRLQRHSGDFSGLGSHLGLRVAVRPPGGPPPEVVKGGGSKRCSGEFHFTPGVLGKSGGEWRREEGGRRLGLGRRALTEVEEWRRVEEVGEWKRGEGLECWKQKEGEQRREHPAPPSPELRGVLWQQTSGLFSRWKERFFLLTREVLQCYRRGERGAGELLYQVRNLVTWSSDHLT